MNDFSIPGFVLKKSFTKHSALHNITEGYIIKTLLRITSIVASNATKFNFKRYQINIRLLNYQIMYFWYG